MSQAERAADTFRVIEENLPGKLDPHTRMDPKHWTREMQRAAFGEDLTKVTADEYEELIGFIRRLRPWLKANGKGKEEHPAFKDTDKEIFWLEEIGSDGFKHSISVELRPWEQSAGRNLEPYPKFSMFFEDPTRSVDFSLKFDNTYELTIRNKQTGVVIQAY